jgi:hypothetical protein
VSRIGHEFSHGVIGRLEDTPSGDGLTSGAGSNDETNSCHTAVSRDRDRSRGDLIRDPTRDGAASVKRDWMRDKTKI